MSNKQNDILREQVHEGKQEGEAMKDKQKEELIKACIGAYEYIEGDCSESREYTLVMIRKALWDSGVDAQGLS